jgi:ankyrin repeat protein
MVPKVAELRTLIQNGQFKRALALLRSCPGAATDWRPIMDACIHGEPEILRALLDRGADPNAISQSERRYRPLHRAIEVQKAIKRKPGHLTVLTILLDAGAHVDAIGCWYDGRPLQTAAIAGDVVAASILLDHGARRDISCAVLTGDMTLLNRTLKQDRRRAAAATESGAEPLHLLCSSRLARPCAAAMAERLISAGARPERVASMRHAALPPMHFACFSEKCDQALIEILIAHGATPQDGMYETLFKGDFATTELLVTHGAKVDGRWHNGRPLLCEMVQAGRNKAVAWLLSHDADPNESDAQGCSALHYAASRGTPAPLIRQLLGCGADPRRRNAEGLRPIDLVAGIAKRQFAAVVGRA